MNFAFKNEIDKEVANDNIRCISHDSLPLTICNYTERCQYAKRFNDTNMMCRGLVIDDNYEIVARPFKKFFNYEELGAKQADFEISNIQTILTKEDGSLIIAFHYANEWHTITRGSWKSVQAISAKKLLGNVFDGDKNCTYCFELVGPSNVNVTRAYETDKLILLGVINTNSAVELSYSSLCNEAHRLEFEIPTAFSVEDFAIETIKTNSSPNFEGVVLCNKNGDRCKIKTTTYILLHRTLTGLTKKRIFELWHHKKCGVALDEELSKIPDEFFAEINSGIADVESSWISYYERVTEEWEQAKELIASGMSRRDIAVSYPLLRHVLTCAYSNILPHDVAFGEFVKAEGTM